MGHWTCLAGLLACTPAFLSANDEDRQSLKRLSIEELARIEVTSVSKRTEQLSQTAAAVSVVTHEDIRRSGVTMLAEALRLGVGVDVARINGNTWGISMRGFNVNAANKLLVLVDGRSTYVPLFGGTFWDVQDAFLDDIDRIEVVRGPGGTIWGANAVNGVVNVLSRAASETQGGEVNIRGGANEWLVASARYGAQLGTGHYRVYGKYRLRGPQAFTSGEDAHDGLRFGQAGFRYDSNPGASSAFMFSGALYLGENGFPDRPDGDVSGGHLLGRYTTTIHGGRFEASGYYDRAYRKVPLQFEETRNTGEIDLQHSVRLGRHDLIGGMTAHLSDAEDIGVAGFVFDPVEQTNWTVTGFAQDQIALPRSIFVTVGAKLGRNNYTGLEVQPNARIRFQPAGNHMVWGAVSRAVRLPTRFDTDIRLRNPITGTVALTGSSDFAAEEVTAYEVGYRVIPRRRVLIDVAAFVNRYDDLRSQELRFTPAPLIVLENRLNAQTGGIEVSTTVQPASWWRVHGSYAWLHEDFTFDPGSTDPTGGVFEANDPSHMITTRSYFDFPGGFAADAFLRYVSRRPAPVVPSYAELDLRFGWTPRDRWELSIIGHNLLHDLHTELISPSAPAYAFRRSVFLRSLWRF